MSHQEETQNTQDMLEGQCFSAGLGLPWAKCLKRAKSGPLYLVPDWVEGQQPKLKIMDWNGG